MTSMFCAAMPESWSNLWCRRGKGLNGRVEDVRMEVPLCGVERRIDGWIRVRLLDLATCGWFGSGGFRLLRDRCLGHDRSGKVGQNRHENLG